MREKPILTICVPTRNRQRYFLETASGLIANPRTDVQFVFADNSDDPGLIAEFMGRIHRDERIVYLPPATKTLSMRDNFERCVDAASGEFVCIIGDDDWIDLDLADLLRDVIRRHPEAEAVSWSRPVYFWPESENAWHSVGLQIDTHVGKANKTLLQDTLFRWKDPIGGTPNCPYSVYHGAISMTLMNRIKARFGGRYFENAAADLDSALKVMIEADHLIYSERPFSIAGICPESNGASFKRLSDLKRSRSTFLTEASHEITESHFENTFPFDPNLGNTVVIALVHLWFKSRYALTFDGWEANFALACAQSCATFHTEADYQFAVESLTRSFSIWQQGRYLHDFRPAPFVKFEPLQMNRGPEIVRYFNRIWLPSNVMDARTPGDFFNVAKGILAKVEDLQFTDSRYQPHLPITNAVAA